MLFERATTSTKQGDIGEARAIYEYTKLGYVVCRTLFDSARYDLVVDDGESLKRVQVKTSRAKRKDYSGRGYAASGYEVTLKTSGGNTKVNNLRPRTEGDYDVLFVLTEDGRCWSIPAAALVATQSITVGTSKDKYAEYEIK